MSRESSSNKSNGPVYSSYKFFSAVFPELILELPQILPPNCPQNSANLVLFGTFWYELALPGILGSEIQRRSSTLVERLELGTMSFYPLGAGFRTVWQGYVIACVWARKPQQPSIFADRMARNPLNGFAAILTSKTLFAVTNLQVGSWVAEDLKDGKSTLQIHQLRAYLLWYGKTYPGLLGNGPMHLGSRELQIGWSSLGWVFDQTISLFLLVFMPILLGYISMLDGFMENLVDFTSNWSHPGIRWREHRQEPPLFFQWEHILVNSLGFPSSSCLSQPWPPWNVADILHVGCGNSCLTEEM